MRQGCAVRTLQAQQVPLIFGHMHRTERWLACVWLTANSARCAAGRAAHTCEEASTSSGMGAVHAGCSSCGAGTAGERELRRLVSWHVRQPSRPAGMLPSISRAPQGKEPTGKTARASCTKRAKPEGSGAVACCRAGAACCPRAASPARLFELPIVAAKPRAGGPAETAGMRLGAAAAAGRGRAALGLLRGGEPTAATTAAAAASPWCSAADVFLRRLGAGAAVGASAPPSSSEPPGAPLGRPRGEEGAAAGASSCSVALRLGLGLVLSDEGASPSLPLATPSGEAPPLSWLAAWRPACCTFLAFA